MSINPFNKDVNVGTSNQPPAGSTGDAKNGTCSRGSNKTYERLHQRNEDVAIGQPQHLERLRHGP